MTDGAAPVARDALAAVPSPDITHFLGTCRPDGTPHAAGVGAQWLDGDLYFTSSPAARKARDLAVNPRCTISVRLPGIDLVLDGPAARVTEPETLEQVAAGLSRRRLAGRGRRRRVHRAVQRTQRRAAAVAPVPVHLPHRGRRRDHRAVRRDPLALPALAAHHTHSRQGSGMHTLPSEQPRSTTRSTDRLMPNSGRSARGWCREDSEAVRPALSCRSVQSELLRICVIPPRRTRQGN